MKISYEEIRRIHRLEKSMSGLVEVEPSFYFDLYEFLSEEKKQYLQALSDFSVIGASDFSNAKKMVAEIFSLREKKIIAKALVSVRTQEVSGKGLAVQEIEFFQKIFGLLEGHLQVFDGLFSDSKKSLEEKKNSFETLHVKIVSEVPSFVGYDFKEYGPFSKDEVVELPVKIARLLNERNMAVVSGKEV